MKKSIVLISIIGFLLLVFPMTSGAEISDTLGELTWTLDDDGLLVISGSGNMDSINPYISPAPAWLAYRSNIKTIEIQPGITSIGNGAFYGCNNLTSVTIPDSVSVIGQDAFSNCKSLSSITIPNSVTTIHGYAFSASGLKSIAIPNRVKTIENACFMDCYKLTSITLPDSIIYIDFGAFANCRNLTNIILPNSVRSIDSYAFEYCTNLASINIPIGVDGIGSAAFSGCYKLTSITIPDSVTSIGGSAFGEQTTIVSSLNAYARTWAMNNNIPWSLHNQHVLSFHETVSPTCTETGSEAYWECCICGELFADAEATNMIGNPIPIAIIPHTEVVDPAVPPTETAPGLTEGKHCSVCGKIIEYQRIVLYNDDPSIIDSGTCGENLTWTLSDEGVLIIRGAGEMYDYAPKSGDGEKPPWGKDIKKVIVEEGITSIGTDAFSGCYNLTEVSIGEGLTRIGSWAFSASYRLKSISLPSSLLYIDENAFLWSGITSLAIPENVVSIGLDSGLMNNRPLAEIIVSPNNSTYSSENGLLYNKGKTVLILCPDGKTGNVFIPEGVQRISERAFSGCSDITEIVIPNSVTEIGYRTFAYCSNLTSVAIPSTVEIIDSTAFEDCSDLTIICHKDSAAELFAINYGISHTNQGHDEIVDDAIDPSCIEPGLTEGKHCEICGVLIAQEVVPALGHDIEHHEAKAETCTEVGWNAYDVCKREGCDLTTYEEIPALGHDPEHHEAKAPTCTDIGWNAYDTCKREGCDYTTYVEIPASGHHLEQHETQDPTCYADGVESYWSCDICKKLFSDAEARNEIDAPVMIPAGHTLIAHGKVDATCSESGTEAYWSCNVCNKLFSDREALHEIDDPVVIAAKGHRLTAQAKVDSTCSQIGTEAYWQCDICGKLFSDAEASTEIDAPIVIAVKPHTEVIDPEVAPTETTPGLTEGKHCSVCGEILVPQKIVLFNDDPSIIDSGTCGENLIWTLSNEGVLTVSGSGQMVHFALDAEGYGSDDYWLCHKSEIVRVIIGNGITSIGDNAFANCENLTSAVIPEGITRIGHSAFTRNHHLTDITIPESVTEIGWFAFYECRSLTSLTIPANVSSIGSSVFYDCRNLTLLVYEGSQAYNYALRNNIAYEVIGNHEHTLALHEAIDSTCSHTGTEAYWQCNACGKIFSDAEATTEIDEPIVIAVKPHTEVIDPAVAPTETTPGLTEGKHCSVCGEILVPQEIVLSNDDPLIIDSGTCGENLTWMLNDQGVLTISGTGEMVHFGIDSEDYWLRNKSDIRRVELSEGVTSIGDNSFANCENLTSAVIPYGITRIGHSAFTRNHSLTEITIPESVTEFGWFAFYECRSITSLTIPASVTSIGSSVFYDCRNLTIQVYENSAAHTYAISNNIPYEVIGIHCHTLVKHEAVDSTCSQTGIEEYWQCNACGKTFSDAEATTEIDEPIVIAVKPHTEVIDPAVAPTETTPGLTEGKHCSVCGEILVPQIVIPIEGDMTITDSGTCGGNLTWTLYNNGLLRISGTGPMDDYSFYDDDYSEDELTTAPWGVSCTSVIVDEGVTSIGEYAFCGCSRTTHITIADSVKNIGRGAFWCCRTLLSLTIPYGVPSIGPWAISGCLNLKSVTIPASVTSIGIYAFDACPVLTSIELPKGITSIGYGAFFRCDNLTMFVYENSEAHRYAINNNMPYELIGSHKHTLTKHEAVDSTCTETGTEAYWVCSACNRMFSDAAATNEISSPILIQPKEHILIEHPLIEASCTADGVQEYWSCILCGKLFSDAEATNVIETPAIITATGHTLTAHPKEVSNNTETEAYWSCDICGKLFSDAVGMNEIKAPVVIDTSGHVWGEAQYTWSPDNSHVTAKRICENDNTHIQEETVAVKKTIIPPTDNYDGSYVYESESFTNEAFTAQRREGTIDSTKKRSVLYLPSSLTTIEEEAFANTSFKALIVPETCTEIKDYAFKDCKELQYIRISKGTIVSDHAFDGCNDVVVDICDYKALPTPTPKPTPTPTPTPVPKTMISIYDCATIKVPSTMYLSGNMYYDSESSLIMRYGKLNYTSYASLKTALQSAYGSVSEFTLNGIKMLGIAQIDSSYTISGVAFIANNQAIMITFLFTDDQEGQMSADCINSIRLTTSTPTPTPSPTLTGGSVHEVYGKTIAEANILLEDKLVDIGDGYYSNGYFGVTLDSGMKINWIAILDGTKYNLFGVRKGMNWVQAQATLGGFSDWGWSPINNSPNDDTFVNTKYSSRRVHFTKDSNGKVKNVIYGLFN